MAEVVIGRCEDVVPAKLKGALGTVICATTARNRGTTW